MAGNLSDYAEQKILALSVGKSTWAKPDLYCALYTVAPTETGGGTEVATTNSSALTGYQRVKISGSETVLYGSFSAGSSTTLTTTGLTGSAWVGADVTILSGTGAGSTGTVTANSTTQFTVTSWSGTAPSGSGIFVAKLAASTVWGTASDGMIKNNGTYKASIPYTGTWNASTNTPTLANGTGTTGTTYLVSTAGTFNTVAYAQGEFIQYDGSTWGKVGTPYTVATDNTNGGRIEFPPALSAWGTVVAVGLVDAATSGNLIWYGTLTATKSVLASETVAFAPSDLVLSLD